MDWAKKNALAADHFELNKFTGPKDGRYISVSGEINNIVHKGQGILKCRQNGKVRNSAAIMLLIRYTQLCDNS